MLQFWKLYETNEALEIVNETITMGDEYDKEEVLRMIQLGLLYTQAFIAERSLMFEIVAMLVSKRDINNLQTTVPMKPAFLGYTVSTSNSEFGTSSSASDATVSTFLTARQIQSHINTSDSFVPNHFHAFYIVKTL